MKSALLATFCFLSSAFAIEYTFELKQPGEVAVEMRASAPGTSWREGAAVAVRVEVDGRYSQHITLFMGSAEHPYRFLLGPLLAGKHRLRVVMDRELSSPQAENFAATFDIQTFEPSSPEYDAISRAPIVYARPDTLGRATDVPLLAYYESIAPPADASVNAARILQYTWVFSNEDGGTRTAALMARWGRAVDIEYISRVYLDDAGRPIAETFQGKDHKELPFQGTKLGQHPLLGISALNNIFSDKAESAVRTILWPARADLAAQSREGVIDREPWVYQVMAHELEREGKLAEIADPRQFLYVEALVATRATGLSFGVQLKNGLAYRADRGRADLRIERSGWVRTAIELLRDARFEDVDRIQAFCEPRPKSPAAPPEDDGFCEVAAIRKLFMLDETYRPGPAGAVKNGLPARMRPGESARF